jgi:hypothetical protein
MSYNRTVVVGDQTDLQLGKANNMTRSGSSSVSHAGFGLVLAGVIAATLLAGHGAMAQDAAAPVGVVSFVKVLSDKVPDVSSIEAWKKSFITDGMGDQDKALAVWKSNVMFVYQDSPPIEERHEGCVADAIKSFNVYGYGMCCCAASRVESLARAVGLEARGWGITGHSVPEVKWDGTWHLLDASLCNYFTMPDGKIASVEQIVTAVKAWKAANPEAAKNLDATWKADGWTGWKKGPELLANCKFYDAGGWWPAKTHGWGSTMVEYAGGGGTPFPYEYGYSQGYQVNVQLRVGEKLTRNWFNKGLHVNAVGHEGGEPGCLKTKIGEGFMAFIKRDYGDLNEYRIGSGVLEYDVPLANGEFRPAALRAENLACKADDKAGPALHVKDAGTQGILELDMPCSYVYLTGKIALDAVVGEGGKVRVFLSDNNGLDWKEVATIDKSGPQALDIQGATVRKYDYRLRVILDGKGTGLEALKITHDVQCSQRALPTLDRGDNTITFSAGPAEGTVTIEGTSYGDKKGKNVQLPDYQPVVKDLDPQFLHVKADGASATFTVATPGDMVRLRMGGFYRLRDAKDQWQMQVSFDGGKTFKTVDTQTGPYQGICKYITVADVPAGTKEAQVRWVGAQRNTTCLFSARIDADYKLPAGGFRPVQVTYLWEEGGIEKKDVHLAAKPAETWKIQCAGKPAMKSLIVELAK